MFQLDLCYVLNYSLSKPSLGAELRRIHLLTKL